MKKFSFSLETVLDYKNQVLDSLQNDHANAVKQMLTQEERVEQLNRQYVSCNQEFNEKKVHGLTVIEALQYETYLRNLEEKIKKEYQKLEECKKEEERRRAAVVEAKKETSSIEKLKEKKWEQYQKEVQKSEELFVEEFVTYSRLAQK
ncbi:MAG: flagellar export protein FliJ [Epulopiscium sp.]|jgi:flagellar FliJ protein|nr:flagellar export protein FliJ [Candidatus Epulonipiscium sp.]